MDFITTPSPYLSMLKCENGDFLILMRDLCTLIAFPDSQCTESFQFENIEFMGEIMVSNTREEVLICKCNTLQVMQGRLQFQELGGVE
jgi:hypothetical protein